MPCCADSFTACFKPWTCVSALPGATHHYIEPAKVLRLDWLVLVVLKKINRRPGTRARALPSLFWRCFMHISISPSISELHSLRLILAVGKLGDCSFAFLFSILECLSVSDLGVLGRGHTRSSARIAKIFC